MRKAVLLAAIVVAAVAATLGGAAASASEATSPRTVRVDDVLLNRLEANPSGGVTAIVTTWNRDGLDAVEAAGVRGTRLKVMPMIITSALTKTQLTALEAMPEVRSVWGQREFKTYMEDSTWITKARYVWSTNTSAPDTHRGFNITGRGVELAVIDTGFDGKHEDGDNLIEYCNSMRLGDRYPHRGRLHAMGRHVQHGARRRLRSGVPGRVEHRPRTDPRSSWLPQQGSRRLCGSGCQPRDARRRDDGRNRPRKRRQGASTIPRSGWRPTPSSTPTRPAAHHS